MPSCNFNVIYVTINTQFSLFGLPLLAPRESFNYYRSTQTDPATNCQISNINLTSAVRFLILKFSAGNIHIK